MPCSQDGFAVACLVKDSPPLDVNSTYCNLLQCTHFAGTCVIAERNGQVVGWLSAYVPPDAEDMLFIWQIAVHPNTRGAGLAGKLLDALLERPQAARATILGTTITDANTASWALFSSFARRRNLRLQRRELFLGDAHFGGMHDTEHLVTLSPLRHMSEHAHRSGEN
jgi:L-2,4-diaminobutyric acid acetyltransferase